MKLFTIDDLSVLAFPSPIELKPVDPQWGWEGERRKAALLADRDDFDPGWILRAADLSLDLGAFQAAIAYAEWAETLPKADAGAVGGRGLLIRCIAHLALGEGAAADRCARRLDDWTRTDDNPLLGAIALLAREKNRQKNPEGYGEWTPPCDDLEAMAFFDEAARRFEALGEIDLAIRSHQEGAEVRFSVGLFFPGTEKVEEATALMREHGRWSMLGRLTALPSSVAADQGYRRGVAEALRSAEAWCDYLGDALGRVQARLALGRLMGYEMAGGVPRLAIEPDRILRLASEEAETLGLRRLVTHIDSTRAWIFEKAGLPDRSREILGLDGDSDERAARAQSHTDGTERVAERIRLNNALRLHDGIEDSLEAFFIYNAMRNDAGVLRDLLGIYANRAGEGIYAGGGIQVFMFSEAGRLPHFEGLEGPVARAMEDRTTYLDIHEVGTPGRGLWFQRRVVPSGDGVVITMRDVTAEKRIETALREAAEIAEKSERAKSAFLASMSHEIRTPLNGVLGLARMLAETDLDSIQKSFVDDIVMSGDMLLDLLGDVLDISRIESQDMKISPSPVSLRGIVESVVKLFRGQARERGTRLTFRIASDVSPTVWADGVRLRQILSNLVGNAVKFTREGEVSVEVSRQGEETVFHVRDTGIGIAPDRMEAIFDRFQQAGDPSYGGTGLGLTIAQALAELMGGRLEAESELGRGSVFRASLPLRDAEPSVEPPVARPPRRFDGQRVLLVDDNRVNLLVSSHALRRAGCEVTFAEDGRQALERLDESEFDLVLMDVRMPILNGLEATREIRLREAGGPRMPVVALTAGALAEEHDECYQAGMDDVATKPITPEAIQSLLARWLP